MANAQSRVLGPAVLAALVAAPLCGQPRPATVDDLMAMRTVVDVEIAPDGEQVAYAVSTPSLETDEHRVALFVVPSAGGEPRRLAADLPILNAPMPAPRLRWTPDSKAVGVLALADGRPQAFAVPLAPLDGAEARQLTAAPEGVFAFDFSPDGGSLAYLTRDPPPPEEARRRAMVVEAGAPGQPARLMVRPLAAGGEPRAVSPAGHFVESFSWAPAGDELAYAAAPRGGFTAQYEQSLYLVAAAGGEPRPVVRGPGLASRPRVSPDGRSVAYVSTGGRVDIMAARVLAVVPYGGGAPRLYPLADKWVNELVWAPDSRSIYLQGNDGLFGQRQQMFEQPVVRVRLDDGHAEQVTAGPGVCLALSLDSAGRRLAYRAVEPRTMGDVAVLDTASGETRRLTEVNPELAGLAVGELRPVSWRSFDGMEIWGLLLTPPGWDGPGDETADVPRGEPEDGRWEAGRRLPLLVYVHGGPGGGVTYGLFPQFMHTVGQVDPYPTAALAGAGYAVLFPMPRGGAGYGEAGQRTIVGRWGEDDARDILAGVDAMIERGVADPDRLGLMGASYGGFMTNWLLTRTDRFKAASAAASIADLADVRLIPDGGEIMTHYFGEPWESPEGYAAHSPLTFVERVTTPLLLQHGERDPRVPVAGAWKMYRALAALGRTVELDVYPKGGHVMHQPQLQREVMQRNLEWFRRWIPPGAEARSR